MISYNVIRETVLIPVSEVTAPNFFRRMWATNYCKFSNQHICLIKPSLKYKYITHRITLWLKHTLLRVSNFFQFNFWTNYHISHQITWLYSYLFHKKTHCHFEEISSEISLSTNKACWWPPLSVTEFLHFRNFLFWINYMKLLILSTLKMHL